MADCTCGPDERNGRVVKTSCCDLHENCDYVDCRALRAPLTLDEYRAAWEHWRSHGLYHGCAHGC